MMHTCLICIGSNYDRENKVRFARERLKEFFPTVTFEEERETEPVNLSNPALFTNQIGVFTTAISKEEVTRILKEIEYEAGRRASDKEEEKIVLDIDLIQYDEMLLKSLII